MLLLTPLLILVALGVSLSPVFLPHGNPLGLLCGLVPGFLEEIGWTDFAFPRMQARQRASRESAASACSGVCGICRCSTFWRGLPA